ncbi:VOC family protein [Vulgatibacter incomptus]|uniref:Putative hydroxylase n=1 Tax=Vulgatibacter incomptus TaxID=1391653 RepID=A0A0K1PJ53_9BACT|nr:VOC family protein [Vulgatibacter incomptus]AKU93134.1 putative hydroxylase [Vulgatibacter incomptus]
MSAESARFVWYDLMTTNLEQARSFYTDVIGWKTRQWSDGKYEMWLAGENPVGGIGELPDEAKKAGALPHWLGFASTRDVDATVKKAQGLDAQVLVPGTDIPDVGRFAVLADPQGAVFAVFASKETGEMGQSQAAGNFSWAELNTTDWKAAWKFYSDLFGWKPTRSMDMGSEFGEYFMFGTDTEKSMGGMSNAASVMKAHPHWLHYINVKDIDGTVKKIEQKGGKVLNGPMEVPGGDRIAGCMDPQGAAFAIVEVKPR